VLKEGEAIFVAVVKVTLGFYTKQKASSGLRVKLKPLLTGHHLAETSYTVDSSACAENLWESLTGYPD
jgi:hypothetical protein